MTFKFKSWKTAVLGTLGALGVYLAAMAYVQPPVIVPDVPELQQVSDTNYRLVNDFAEMVSIDGRAYTITVKAGFETDGASIPKFLRPELGLVPMSPTVIKGAVIHDALYESELLSREIADRILRLLCLRDGTESHKAAAIYQAVHDCGAIVWDGHSDASVRLAREFVSVVIQ